MSDLTSAMANIAGKVLSLTMETPNDKDLGAKIRELVTSEIDKIKDNGVETVQRRGSTHVRK